MKITAEQLIKIAPYSKKRAALFVPFLNAAMEEFNINTPVRQVAFLAQILHESGSLVYTAEIASGANYEGRIDLGNKLVGDGKRFKGRGLIQITGRTNYVALMLSLGLNCIENPAVVEEPENACRSAAWWWNEHNLNVLADVGTQDSFIKISKVINCGNANSRVVPNGLTNRLAFWVAAKRELGVK